MAKNPPANTGDVESAPGPGRFHMLEDSAGCGVPQLLNHVLHLLKPVGLEPVLQRHKRSHHIEKPVLHMEEWALLSATVESLCTAMKTQTNQTSIN